MSDTHFQGSVMAGRRYARRAGVGALAAAAVVAGPVLAAGAQRSAREAAAASPQDTIRVTRKGTRTSQRGPTETFTGAVRIDPLFEPNAGANAGAAYVTFQPGARTAWHSHPRGQRLVVTAGVGRVQRWQGPVDEIRPGDVVWIPPGVKHWHGAARTTAMTHLAVQEALDGKVVTWVEKVSDAQYGAAPRGPSSTSRGHGSMRSASAAKIRMVVEGTPATPPLTATLDDTETARDFASLLPLSLTLEDYAATEKIAYLPRKLSTTGAPRGTRAQAGDITYYAPWGNLALFHNDFEFSQGLVTLGRLDAGGVETLRRAGSLRVTIERIEQE